MAQQFGPHNTIINNFPTPLARIYRDVHDKRESEPIAALISFNALCEKYVKYLLLLLFLEEIRAARPSNKRSAIDLKNWLMGRTTLGKSIERLGESLRRPHGGPVLQAIKSDRLSNLLEKLGEFNSEHSGLRHGGATDAASAMRILDRYANTILSELDRTKFFSNARIVLREGDGKELELHGVVEPKRDSIEGSWLFLLLKNRRDQTATKLPLAPLFLAEIMAGEVKLLNLNAIEKRDDANRSLEYFCALGGEHRSVLTNSEDPADCRLVAEVRQLVIDFEDSKPPAKIDAFEDLKYKNEDFSGRGWLVNLIEEFLVNQSEKLLLVKGFPGTGKTALMLDLQKKLKDDKDTQHRLNCVSSFYCFSTVGTSRKWAQEWILQVQRELLLKTGISVKRSKEDGEFAAIDSLKRQIEKIFKDDYEVARILIAVDGLDEADQAEIPRIVRYLSELSHVPGVMIILTSRDIDELREISGTSEITLNLDEDQRQCEDIKFYVQTRLPSLDDQKTRQLLSKVGSSFLYAATVVTDLRREALTVEEITNLPPGMKGYYGEILRNRLPQRFNSHELDWKQDGWHLLLVLAATRKVVDQHYLAKVLGSGATRVRQSIEQLSEVLRFYDSGENFYFFHLSFLEHIQEHYEDEVREAHGRIARAYVKIIDNRQWGEIDDYGRRWLAYHLHAARLFPEMKRLLENREFWQRQVEWIQEGDYDDMEEGDSPGHLLIYSRGIAGYLRWLYCWLRWSIEHEGESKNLLLTVVKYYSIIWAFEAAAAWVEHFDLVDCSQDPNWFDDGEVRATLFLNLALLVRAQPTLMANVHSIIVHQQYRVLLNQELRAERVTAGSLHSREMDAFRYLWERVEDAQAGLEYHNFAKHLRRWDPRLMEVTEGGIRLTEDDWGISIRWPLREDERAAVLRQIERQGEIPECGDDELLIYCKQIIERANLSPDPPDWTSGDVLFFAFSPTPQRDFAWKSEAELTEEERELHSWKFRPLKEKSTRRLEECHRQTFRGIGDGWERGFDRVLIDRDQSPENVRTYESLRELLRQLQSAGQQLCQNRRSEFAACLLSVKSVYVRLLLIEDFAAELGEELKGLEGYDTIWAQYKWLLMTKLASGVNPCLSPTEILEETRGASFLWSDESLEKNLYFENTLRFLWNCDCDRFLSDLLDVLKECSKREGKHRWLPFSFFESEFFFTEAITKKSEKFDAILRELQSIWTSRAAAGFLFAGRESREPRIGSDRKARSRHAKVPRDQGAPFVFDFEIGANLCIDRLLTALPEFESELLQVCDPENEDVLLRVLDGNASLALTKDIRDKLSDMLLDGDTLHSPRLVINGALKLLRS